jgi:hypothetical protein
MVLAPVKNYGARVRLSPGKAPRPLSWFRVKQTRTIFCREYFGSRR